MTFNPAPLCRCRLACALGSLLLVLVLASPSEAQTNRLWSSGATTGDWGIAANWSGGNLPVAGNRVIFTNNAQLDMTNTLGYNINGVIFSNNATADRTIHNDVNITSWSGVVPRIEASAGSGGTYTFVDNINQFGSATNTHNFGSVGGNIVIEGGINGNDVARTNVFYGDNSSDTSYYISVGEGLTNGGAAKVIVREYANVMFMGASDYTGNTEIDRGALQLGSGTTDGSLSESSVIYIGSGATNGGATLVLGKTDGGQVIGGPEKLQVNIWAGSGERTLQSLNTTGTNEVARTIELRTTELTITNAAGGALLLSGAIGSTNTNSVGSLRIQAAGNVILSGNNYYTGGTVVESGTVTLDTAFGVSAFGTGEVTIEAPATLTGTGSIAGNTIVHGTVAPGNSPGLLDFEGDLTFESASALVLEISSVGTRGINYDAINVGGNFTIDPSAMLTFVYIDGYSPTLGDTFDVFDFTPGDISGTFDFDTNIGGGLSWDTSELYTAGTVTVVPEPSIWALAVFGGAALIALRLRRRNRGKNAVVTGAWWCDG